MSDTTPPETAQTPVMMTVADAPHDNWVDRFAPDSWRPYLRLMRLDRPIGTWLLLFPCWWSLALAEIDEGLPHPSLWYMFLFAIGALVMRGAGCAYNDYIDRDFDAQVARTASRPIPSGQVTPEDALVLVGVLRLHRPDRAASVQLVHGFPWRGVTSAGADLPVHEALHVLAAARPRPRLQLGRSGRLGGGRRRVGTGPCPALLRRRRLDHRL